MRSGDSFIKAFFYAIIKLLQEDKILPKRGTGMARRKKRKKKKSGLIHLENEVLTSVFGVVMLAVSLVVTMAYFGVSSGWLSNWVSRGLDYLFGGGAFLFPFILLVASLYILISHKPRVIASAIVGGALVLLSLLGFIEIIGRNGSHVGGWIGFLFSWPFYKAIGFWGSLVSFGAIFISGILITFRIPLKSYARDVFTSEGEKKEVKQRGLLNTLGGVTRLTGKKKDRVPPRPADETVTVNAPKSEKEESSSNKDEKKSFGFNIIPLSKDYKYPPLDLLEKETGSPISGDIKENALIIQKTLENFDIPVEMAEVNVGPSITQFTLKPATGVKLSRLTALQNDLALALASHPIRIEAPIPGKSLVGIEIPNKKSMIVRLRGMLSDFNPKESETPLNIAIGRNVAGESYWTSLTKMPHMLIAGATGTGKSVAINSLLLTLLFQHSPEVLRLILIDPKRVELTFYNGIPHLLTPVITQPNKSIAALKWAVSEMERRYEVLSESKVRDIAGYNQKEKKEKDGEFMPYLVIVIDELADIMAAYGREVEGAIVRLAQMARAVGIHLIVSTQRPSVEVITGLIKANITNRIAFQVASQIDSRTILDSAGAEKLLGSGDMLFIGNDFTKPKRFQGTFVSEDEVKKIVSFLQENFSTQNQPVSDEEETEGVSLDQALEGKKSSSDIDLDQFTGTSYEDDLYPEARELVLRANKASASMLQRRLRVGYARAARLLDMLEEEGVVGSSQGAKPREILISAPSEEGSEEFSSNYNEEDEE